MSTNGLTITVEQSSTENLHRAGQCHRIAETVRKRRHRQTSRPRRQSAPLPLPRPQPSTCRGLQCPDLGKSIRHRHQTHQSASIRRWRQIPLVCSHQTEAKGPGAPGGGGGRSGFRTATNDAASMPSGLPQVTIATVPPGFVTRRACPNASAGFPAY